jgi:methionyl aminopeptidase
MTRAAGQNAWRSGIERKSARELALMRQSGKILAVVLDETRAHIRPGVTTRQLDTLAEKVILQHAATPSFKGYPGPYPFPCATTISINDELVHGIPGPRVVREGDLVSVDCGVIYQGFHADAAFSVGVGQCSPVVERLLAVTAKALEVGIQQMRPGNHTGDISAAIQQWVESQGFQVVRDYTSHGIGREMHEDPAVPNYGKAGKGPTLHPGITIAIEPMVLVGTRETRTLPDQWTVVSKDGSLTAHFEHTVAVTDGEPEILTRLED